MIDVKIQSIYTFESLYSNHVFISVAFPVNNIIPPDSACYTGDLMKSLFWMRLLLLLLLLVFFFVVSQ